jgi:squalene-hopene/tetraprenyl-beta-curcumene cyclase
MSSSDTISASQRLEAVLADARDAMTAYRQPDGHWIFELEADVTISAEFILLQHFLGEIDEDEVGALSAHIRSIQSADGSWPLFAKGDGDLSATVKAYYALKLAGDDPNAPHMQKARGFVLARGGAARVNVFTRIALALFGAVPWRAVPAMPIEIMLLPRWFPFHLAKVSYWSRTVIVPLLILMALKPQARNPGGVGIRELFVTPPELERDYISNSSGDPVAEAFIRLDRMVRAVEPRFPRISRDRALKAAVDFMTERLNGEEGLGAIFPAMANAVMAMDALGYAADDPAVVTAKRALKRLLITTERGTTHCQPCLSPVWDTSLAMHALMEAGEPSDGAVLDAAARWLLAREITDVKGDWAWNRPDVEPSGWAFQYANPHYPDTDDTAVVGMALHRIDPERHRPAIERAARWIVEMQSADGGWGAFDADNTKHYLNHIPFADHGALLDPPTVDVTARCLGFLVQIGYGRDHPVIRRGVAFLKAEQEPDGSWFGRWGANYVYGTWSALCALNAVGESPQSRSVRRAVDWLEARQQDDGGWGEDLATYWEHRRSEVKASTPSQTAWALLGLMAAGEIEGKAVRRGVSFLERHPRNGPRWEEELWTGVGFPRVFYLKYHGYSAYFPLWALGRYRRLTRKNERRVEFGI